MLPGDAVNALPFYIAGVVARPAQRLDGCAARQWEAAPEAEAMGQGGTGWHGFSTAQVLVDMRSGSLEVRDAGGERGNLPASGAAVDVDGRLEQGAGAGGGIELPCANEWRRIPVAEQSFYQRIAASAASHRHVPNLPSRNRPGEKQLTGVRRQRGSSSHGQADAEWSCEGEGKGPLGAQSSLRRDNGRKAAESREKWLAAQFASLTEDLLQAVRQDRVNARGFSRELLELKERPLPLASGLFLPRRNSPRVARERCVPFPAGLPAFTTACAKCVRLILSMASTPM